MEATRDIYLRQKGMKPKKKKQRNALLEDVKGLKKNELHPDYEPWEDPQDFDENFVVK